MANKHIDLSEFLSGTPAKHKVPTLNKPSYEPQFIICAQCHGSGKYVVTETHTPALSEESENKLTELGKILPVQQKLPSDPIKCQKCRGHGSYHLPDDVRAREVTLFWTRSTCRCGAKYDGPAHQNSCTIRNHVYRPIVVEGRLFGWRFREVTYTPTAQILPIHAQLPMKIEYYDYQIEACRKCIHEHVIICLPDLSKEIA